VYKSAAKRDAAFCFIENGSIDPAAIACASHRVTTRQCASEPSNNQKPVQSTAANSSNPRKPVQSTAAISSNRAIGSSAAANAPRLPATATNWGTAAAGSGQRLKRVRKVLGLFVSCARAFRA
jgi:hypothetical protein